MQAFKLFRKYDLIIITTTALLVAIGLLVLYSSGIKPSQVNLQLDTSRQFLYVAVGLVLLGLFARMDYRILRNYALPLYFITLGMLLVVNFFGAQRLGATRWITIGFFQFQPSELAKLVLIIVLAKFFAMNYEKTRQLRYIFISFLYVLPLLALLLLQPDLATASVLGAIWLVMTIATRVRKQWLVLGAVLAIIAVPLSLPFLHGYQRQRIETFLNPTANPTTTGYNVNQAIIAVGSGGWFGQGLGAGSQSQGNFLPSQHTDFIFAVLAEKLGFVGGVLVILLFAVLLTRSVMVVRKSRDRFGSFLVIGVIAMLLFHLFINIGMNLGLVPVAGIPLPFISAGGSSMMVSLIGIGVIESVAIRRRKAEINLD